MHIINATVDAAKFSMGSQQCIPHDGERELDELKAIYDFLRWMPESLLNPSG